MLRPPFGNWRPPPLQDGAAAILAMGDVRWAPTHGHDAARATWRLASPSRLRGLPNASGGDQAPFQVASVLVDGDIAAFDATSEVKFPSEWRSHLHSHRTSSMLSANQ